MLRIRLPGHAAAVRRAPCPAGRRRLSPANRRAPRCRPHLPCRCLCRPLTAARKDRAGRGDRSRQFAAPPQPARCGAEAAVHSENSTATDASRARSRFHRFNMLFLPEFWLSSLTQGRIPSTHAPPGGVASLPFCRRFWLVSANSCWKEIALWRSGISGSHFPYILVYFYRETSGIVKMDLCNASAANTRFA